MLRKKKRSWTALNDEIRLVSKERVHLEKNTLSVAKGTDTVAKHSYHKLILILCVIFQYSV